MRISDGSSDVCSSDLRALPRHAGAGRHPGGARLSATVWNPAFAGVTREGASMTFEEVQRLQTGAAAPLRLAGRRADQAELFAVGRTAISTADHQYTGATGGGYDAGVDPRPRITADPRGCPGHNE